ncbi:unnamed protein product [Ixodes hexagonus]
MESTTDQRFWTTTLSSLWTADELLGRSVTGTSSRRKKKAAPKPGLDPIRLQAAKRVYRRYIRLFPTGGDPIVRFKKARQLASSGLATVNRYL